MILWGKGWGFHDPCGGGKEFFFCSLALSGGRSFLIPETEVGETVGATASLARWKANLK